MCFANFHCYAICTALVYLFRAVVSYTEVPFTPVLFRVRGNFVLEPLCLPNTSFVTHQRDATSVSERGLFTKVASFVTRKELGSRKPWKTIPGQPSFRYKLHVHRPYSALFRLESNSIMKFFALLSRKMYRENGPLFILVRYRLFSRRSWIDHHGELVVPNIVLYSIHYIEKDRFCVHTRIIFVLPTS